MSWYRAPFWDLRPDITSYRNVAVWNLRSCFCGAPSLTRGRVCLLSVTVSNKVEVTLRLTVGQSVCLGIEHPCGTFDLPIGMLLSDICGLVSMGRPLWREDGSPICSVIAQWSVSLRTRNHTLLSRLRLSQPGGPGSRISIPRNRVAQLYPRALGYCGPYPSYCLIFKTQLNSIGLSVPHRKHITSPLRVQQTNAIYGFVAMVY
jgi:hypothetical protein